jgi:hypothetical protein
VIGTVVLAVGALVFAVAAGMALAEWTHDWPTFRRKR